MSATNFQMVQPPSPQRSVYTGTHTNAENANCQHVNNRGTWGADLWVLVALLSQLSCKLEEKYIWWVFVTSV